MMIGAVTGFLGYALWLTVNRQWFAFSLRDSTALIQLVVVVGSLALAGGAVGTGVLALAARGRDKEITRGEDSPPRIGSA